MPTYPEKIDSKFRYVLLAARRAEDILRGATPKLAKPTKHTSVAMKEISDDLVEWDYGVVEGAEDEVESEE